VLRLAAIGLALLLVLAGIGAYFGSSSRSAKVDEPPEQAADHSGRRGQGEAIQEPVEAVGKRYALLIGVNEYDNLPRLRYAENDVAELADVLRPAGYEVTLLTGAQAKRDHDLAPTRKNLDAHLARVAGKCRRPDLLLLAFAGHGMQFDDQAHFCPSDADEKDPATMTSLHRVYAELGRSRAGARLLLVDACRHDGRRAPAQKAFAAPSGRPPSGVAVLFSCKKGEFANETPTLKHGVFFHYVLEGLRGRAMNEDGEVTWDRLNDHVKRQVSRNVGRLVGGGASQTPHALSDLEGESPVLLRDPTKRPGPSQEPDEPEETEPPKSEGPPPITAKKEKKEPPAEVKLGGAFTNSIGMKFVRVKAGTFLMGSPSVEADRYDDELSHPVTLTRDYYLGVTEVTQKQYREVMGDNPSWFSADGGGRKLVDGLDTDDFPVERVTWHDAQEFLKRLEAREEERKSRLTYRLPTEAEWEYACRGGADSSRKPFHFRRPWDSLGLGQANFDARSPFGGGRRGDWLGRTNAVGKNGEANALGLFDLHGNVWEWCSDWYAPDYYRDSPVKDPAGPDDSTARVVRGGSWYAHGWRCRAARRNGLAPTGRHNDLGFRVAVVRD
jgi:formylglycine-generating enzyme required for sulfatase activity